MDTYTVITDSLEEFHFNDSHINTVIREAKNIGRRTGGIIFIRDSKNRITQTLYPPEYKIPGRD